VKPAIHPVRDAAGASVRRTAGPSHANRVDLEPFMASLPDQACMDVDVRTEDGVERGEAHGFRARRGAVRDMDHAHDGADDATVPARGDFAEETAAAGRARRRRGRPARGRVVTRSRPADAGGLQAAALASSFSVAMSITKRYFTSLLSMRS
jgi:hypothetical protein